MTDDNDIFAESHGVMIETKHDAILLSGNEVKVTLEKHFDIFVDVVAVSRDDNDDTVIGFAANFCPKEELGHPEDSQRYAVNAAAKVWNVQYQGKVFAEYGAIIITFMDCLHEQQEQLIKSENEQQH